MSRPGLPTDRPPARAATGLLAAGAVFLTVLAVYLRTLHTGLPGPDSGELITVARVLGVGHPPGYPLYTLLAHAFGRLVPWGPYAWKINLLSAILHAGAAALLCEAIRRMTGRAAAGVGAALALAFSRPFWRSALVAEAFPLNSLMACAMWLAFAALLRDAGLVPAGRKHPVGGPRPWPWPPAVLLLLAAAIPAQHHTLALLAVPLGGVALALVLGPAERIARIVPAYRRPYDLRPVHAWAAAGLVLLGLAPLVHLPLAAARDAALVWGEPGSLAGLRDLLTRAEYGSFDVAALTARQRTGANHPLTYLRALPEGFGPVGLLLAAVGLIGLALAAVRGRGGPLPAAARPVLAALLGAAVLQGLFLARIPLATDVPYLRGVVERFYPLPHIGIAILVGLGIAALPARISRVAAGSAAGAVAVLAGLTPLVLHFRTLDQRGNTVMEDLGRNVLASLPRDAVLFSTGDILFNSLTYLTTVEGARPDVVVADQYLMTRSWYVRALRRRHPGLLPPFAAPAAPDSDRYRGDSSSGNARWIEHLAGRRPVAFVGFLDRTYEADYQMVPYGYTLVPYRQGMLPPPRARAEAALGLLATFRIEGFFRPQDPRGPEAESRWRTTQFLSDLCFLLCDREGQALRHADHPGLGVLARFLERYEQMERVPDLELLRAAGFLHVYHPEFRDRPRAEAALARFLALAPPDPRSEGVARLLEAIRRQE